jgi:hypothetical protein
MESLTHEKKEYITLSTHPFYFGHYLNMARHNAYLILSDLSNEIIPNPKSISEENLAEIELLNESKFGNRKPDEIAHRNYLLVKHFPFLREEENPEINPSPYRKITEKFKTALTTLHQLRNCSSHFPVDEKGYSTFDLKPFFSMAVIKAEKRMSTFFSPDDFSMLKNDEKGLYPLNYEEQFTQKGLCFFISFFLEKKYAFQFLSGIKGFKDHRDNSKRATLETFTEHCCRLPYPKLESADFKLDMINELSRCPGALFRVLGETDQQLFIAKSEENEIEGDELQEMVMKRYDDRFPYFALRYFDESKMLEKISFHVEIGRWIKSEHSKPMIVERERRILKEIRTFGELEEYKPERIPDFWQQAGISTDDFDPFSPHYRMVGTRIGISLGKQNKRWPLPGKDANIAPTAILSTYEMPNLFVYAYLQRQGKINEKPSEYIKNYLKRLNLFISKVQKKEILPVGNSSLRKKRDQGNDERLLERREKLQHILDGDEYTLKIADLPDSIREYMLGYKLADKGRQIIHFLKNIQKNTQREMECAGKLKVGEMAQTLARDIVFLSPPIMRNGHPQKLNDAEYDILQKSIAYFSTNINDIFEFLDQHKLISGTQKHPFLGKVNLKDCTGVFDFYQKYLNEKKKWIDNMVVQAEKKSLNLDQFLERNGYFIKIDNKNALEKNYKNTPPYLPRGIFNKPIIEAMKQEGFPVKDNDNVVYALQFLLDKASQTFYSKPRYYNLGERRISSLPEDMQPKELIAAINTIMEALSTESEEYKKLRYFRKDICESEDEIRHHQTTDRVLWMMISELFPASFNLRTTDLTKVGFDLHEDDFLKLPYPMKEKTSFGYEISDVLPIKRYGEFRRFLKDRRLENLLKYFDPNVSVSRERLVEELESYDLKRRDLLQKIHEFEQLVFKYHSGELEYKTEEKQKYIPHWNYLDFVSRKYHVEIPFQESKFVDLRNKLLHNQILFTEELGQLIKQQESDELITTRILNLIGDTYEKMIATIEKEKLL